MPIREAWKQIKDLAERQVSGLIEDNETGMDKPIGDLAKPDLCLLLFQRVDQIEGRIHTEEQAY